MKIARSTRRPASASAASSASAWTRVRGKPSRIAPPRGVGLLEPVEEDADDRVVRNELAAAHVAVGLAAERRAGGDGRPEQVAGREDRARRAAPARIGACVPLPAPGAPRRTTTVIDGHRRPAADVIIG